MSQKNYKQYNKMRGVRENVNPVDEVADVEVDIDESVSYIPTPEEMEIPVEEQVEEPKTESLVGVVENCKRLNIRVQPMKEAAVVCVVNEGTVLLIEPDATDKDWFRVYTEAGVAGFCMRQFVRVNK